MSGTHQCSSRYMLFRVSVLGFLLNGICGKNFQFRLARRILAVSSVVPAFGHPVASRKQHR
jgi:hypothetical protein